jgi:WD40 repeat protein
MQLNGHYLAATSKNNMLKIWDLETNKRLCQLENTNIIQLECLADGFLYASYDPSSSRRKNIYIWKPGFTSPRLYRSDHNYTLCATYGNYFAMVKSANKVEIFDENQNLLRQYEFSQETQIQEIRFSRAYILCKVAEGKRSGQSVIMDEESYKVLGFTV